MRRLIITITILTFAFGVVLTVGKIHSESETNDIPAESPQQSTFLESTPEPAPQPIRAQATPVVKKANDIAQPAAKAFAPLAEVRPSDQRLRNEVKKNPHDTPKALIGFSLDLYDRLQAALPSEAESEKFFGELESCTREQKANRARSVAALCILNARRLADKHESLRSRYTALEASADKKALALSKTVN